MNFMGSLQCWLGHTLHSSTILKFHKGIQQSSCNLQWRVGTLPWWRLWGQERTLNKQLDCYWLTVEAHAKRIHGNHERVRWKGKCSIEKEAERIFQCLEVKQRVWINRSNFILILVMELLWCLIHLQCSNWDIVWFCILMTTKLQVVLFLKESIISC